MIDPKTAQQFTLNLAEPSDSEEGRVTRQGASHEGAGPTTQAAADASDQVLPLPRHLTRPRGVEALRSQVPEPPCTRAPGGR